MSKDQVMRQFLTYKSIKLRLATSGGKVLPL
jgi:hypothetical protein